MILLLILTARDMDSGERKQHGRKNVKSGVKSSRIPKLLHNYYAPLTSISTKIQDPEQF